MVERLENILKVKNMQWKDLANLIGQKPQYISQIKTGKSGIGLTFANSILIAFPDINARWFLLGEGEMFSSEVCENIAVRETEVNYTNKNQTLNPMELRNYLNLALEHIESLKKELEECKKELSEYKQMESHKKGHAAG